MIIGDVGTYFGASGYVVESVPLALYAARSIDRVAFDVLLRNVVEAGGDTDTIASMTGQIAGPWLGASGIFTERL
jgi:ADP-ribosylglycohydrolase